MASPSLVQLQHRVWAWCCKTFQGISAWDTEKERSFRFLEESLELTQAMGLSKADTRRVIDYVYARPAGERTQEVGGVLITLLALCAQQKFSAQACLLTEYDRITVPMTMNKIREKQLAKKEKHI